MQKAYFEPSHQPHISEYSQLISIRDLKPTNGDP